MNNDSVTVYAQFINEQIQYQEQILMYHLKTVALLEILLAGDLKQVTVNTLYHYIWGIQDYLGFAKTLNEFVLSTLVKILNLLESGGSSTPTETLH